VGLRKQPHGSKLNDDLARTVALVESQQVVIPLPVGMCAEKGVFAHFPNNADVHLLTAEAINRVKGILLCIDAANGFLTRHPPFVGKVANMRDVFVTAHPIWLVDARNLKFAHACTPAAFAAGG
jgi:hypothetical protein